MKQLTLLIYFLIAGFSSVVHGQVTFSEVMFDPATNEYHDEFIEVFNISENDSMSIEGWIFSDGQGTDRILSHRGSKKIPPRSFAVILDGSYALNSAVYDNQIPQIVPVFKIDNNSFGASGLSNSSSEALSLINSYGDTVSVYAYSIDNDEGFSDEKIILDSENTADNWANCSIEGGTPGRRNSVSPFDIDAALGSNAIEINEPVFAGDKTEIIVRIINAGLEPVSDSAAVLLYQNRDLNYHVQPMQKLLARIPFHFQSEFDNYIVFPWEDIPAGEHNIHAQLEADWDMNDSNNSQVRKLVVLSRSVSLHINEIKFLTHESEPEWIEIVNSADQPVFLKSWSISDQNDTMKIDTAAFIYKGQYKVIAADSLPRIYDIDDSLVIINDKLPSLNNAGDKISLNQPAGNWVERIEYSSSWLEGEDYRNVSLERINPLLNEALAENWGPCILPQGASPGMRNSIFLSLEQAETRISVSPNPFSPDADGIDDATVISGIISEKSARIRIRIFDIYGRLVRTLADNQYSGSEFRVVWNGRNDRGLRLSIGIYIILIEAINDRNGVYLTEKTSVVLAKKL